MMILNEQIYPALIDNAWVLLLQVADEGRRTLLSYFPFLVRQIFRTLLFTIFRKDFGRRRAIDV
jgi:hypothetical protein